MQETFVSASTRHVESATTPENSSWSQKNSSRIVTVLEKAWSHLGEIVPGLPPVVLLVLSAREYRRRGHFVGEAWRKRHQRDLLHEVAVHPGMFEFPDDLLITILHEAAHAILWERRQGGDQHCCGVSLQGYYHRKEFRRAAEQLGLQVHFLNRRYGHCVTIWPASGIPAQYQRVLRILGQFTVIASKRLPPRVVPVPAKKQVPWVVLGCACSPQRILRCPPAELGRGGIGCRLCGELFLDQG